MLKQIAELQTRLQAADAKLAAIEATEFDLGGKENRFRLMFEQGAMGVAVIHSKTGRYLEVNQRFADIVGYSSAELLQKTFWEITHPDDIQTDHQNMNNFSNGEIKRLQVEKRYIHKNGSIVWCRVHGASIWRDGIKPVFHLAIIEDITERRRIDLALIETENRYQALFENAVDAIHIANENDEIIAVNDRMCELMGYSREELLTMTIPELQAPAVRGKTGEIVRGEIDRYQGQVFESYNIHKDGHIFPVELTVSVMPSEGDDQYFCVLRDISTRKKAEEYLHQSAYLLNEAEKVARLGSFDLNITNGNWTSSQTLQDIFGIDQDYETNIDSWLALVHPDDRHYMDEYFTRYILTQHEDFDREYQIIRANDGAARWVHGLGKLEYDEYDNPVRLIGTIQDITVRKEYENEIQTWRDRYEVTVQTSGHILYDWDPITNEVTYGGAVEDILGYSLSEMAGGLDRWIELIHPDDVAHINKDIDNLIKTQKEAQLKYRIRRRDGAYVLVEDSGNFVFDEDGQATRMVGFVKDISAQEQAAQAIRESEARFRALFDESPIVLWEEDFSEVKNYLHQLQAEGVTDFRTHFQENPQVVLACANRVRTLHVNQACIEAHEAPSAAALMNNLEQIFTPETLSVFADEILTFWEGETHFEAESISQTLTGKPLHSDVRITIPPGYEDTWAKVFVSSIDISERKQAEKALAENEVRYRILFEESPMILWEEDFSAVKEYIDDLKARGISDFISYFSENSKAVKTCAELVKIVGVNQRGLKSREIDSFEDVPENLSPLITNEYIANFTKEIAYFAEGGTAFESEHIGRDAVGNPTFAIIRSIIPRGYEDTWEKVFVSSVDISERKQFERWIEGLNHLKEALLVPGDLDTKIKLVTDRVVEIFKADFCRIWIARPGDRCDQGCIHAEVQTGPHVCSDREHCLHLIASSGRYTHIDGEAHGRVPFGAYKIGRVAAGDEPKFITNDVTHDPRVHDHTWAADLGLVSFAGYRITDSEGVTIGVLALFSKAELSPQADALLETVANTLSQVITATQSEQALQESESRYRSLFESAPVALWEQDLSGIKRFLDDLQAAGITDLRAHFDSHPEDVNLCFSMIKVLGTNRAGLDQSQVENLAELEKTVADRIMAQTIDQFIRQILGMLEVELYQGEVVTIDLAGDKVYTLIQVSIPPQYKDTWERVFVSAIDVTAQKRAEARIRENEIRYRSLFHDSSIEQWEQDHSEIKVYIDTLKTNGVTDFRAYFDSHPDEIIKCIQMIKIIDVNQIVLDFHNAKNPEELKKRFLELPTTDSLDSFKEQLVAFIDGHRNFEIEVESKDLDGNVKNSLLKASIFPAYVDTWERVYLASLDITASRQIETLLKRRAEEMATLHAFTLDINMPTDMHTVFNAIVERATEFFMGSGGGLYICEPEERQARYTVSYQNPNDNIGVVVKYGEGVTGIVAETGTPMIVNNYQHWEHKIPTLAGGPNYRIMSAPISWRQAVTSVIHIYREVSDPEFTQSDLEMLEIFANNAAIGIENTRLIQEAQAHADKLEDRVAQRTADLTMLVNAMTGREVRMAELKEVIQKLRKQITAAGMIPVADDPLNMGIDEKLD